MKYYLGQGSILKGDVDIKENVNIWYNATLRADNKLLINQNSNIQDNVVIHADEYPVTIGENVTIGHGAILHGCTIGDDSLIGMGAIILNNATIGKGCLIGAGTLISENKVIEDYSVVYGNPFKVVRKLNEEEVSKIKKNAIHYVAHAQSELNAISIK